MARGYLSEDAQQERNEGREPVGFDNTTCLRATPNAILVQRRREDGSAGRSLWVPQSVVHADSEVFEQGHQGRLVLFTWWARKEGLCE